ncbi:MAG: GH92 family glycosyl hydrolase [Maribacter sp.]|uniref:GH92 family glycosyl hydrolase n=1 Tax=Maribacter sp. TaxID=1897614 RepID=UPI003297025F
MKIAIKQCFKILVASFFLFGSCTCSNSSIVESVKLAPVDLVYPLLDTENSRWFFFASASRPFGMVNLSPDTEVDGAWGSGYRYKNDTIQGFSHVHAWQLSGLSVLPVTVDSISEITIFKDFKSKFSHRTEQVSPGYHYVELDRYGITAELSSTKRTGLHRYSFSEDKEPALLFNLNSILGPCNNANGVLQRVDSKTLSGELVITATRRRPKPVKLFFHIELNTDVIAVTQDEQTGNYLVKVGGKEVLMKVGISYTSYENAKNNVKTEVPHWDFEQIIKASKEEWNDLLGRISITGGTETQQRRFYTDLWHALQGRRTISDVNGAYPDYTGDDFRIGQLPLDESGKPKFNHYNSDSFWGAQWTLNTLWGLVYPDIMEEFVYSLLQYHKDGGLIPRGPSGGNYTYVMTGASSTPFIVSAVQKGIVTQDLDSIYSALKKNHLVEGIMEKAGYEHYTMTGGGFKHYLANGYVPYPIPEGKFGLHEDGASLTMEYAYQDWTLAQLAKKLGRSEDFDFFMKRSDNYKNVFDTSVGWMRPKDIDGNWLPNYDPYTYENGFNESNGAQSTWFVPHDIEGLAELMGGKSKAVDKLNRQFSKAGEQGFTSGNAHAKELHPEYRRVPINYGNQPSIQTAFVFNKLGRPDLAQFWSRTVVEKVFSGLSPSTGYNGDEDQGLMGSLAVLMKLGLFQMNGGTEDNPKYELGSSLFPKAVLRLPNGNTLQINAQQAATNHYYIQDIQFNGRPVPELYLRHADLIKGGILDYQLADKPSEN